MGLGASTVRVVAAPPPASCRLVMRRKEGLPELVEFVVGGLEAGQQVFALGGPAYLKDIAHNLGESGLRVETLLRNGRLVFLTAPDCVSTLLRPQDAFRRGPLQRNASILRWVSDWSWAYANGADVR